MYIQNLSPCVEITAQSRCCPVQIIRIVLLYFSKRMDVCGTSRFTEGVLILFPGGTMDYCDHLLLLELQPWFLYNTVNGLVVANEIHL